MIILQLVACAAAGILSVKLFRQRQVIYHLALTGIGTITLLIVYRLNGIYYYIALADGCAFLLPFTISRAWGFFRNIPPKQFRLWYPNPAGAEPITASLLKIPVRIKIAPAIPGKKKVWNNDQVPAKARLGKFFHHLLTERSAEAVAIEYRDANNIYYGWEFYEEIAGGIIKRFLDPDLSFIENKVREQATIVARCVTTSPC